LYLSKTGVIKEGVVIIGAYHFCQLRTKFIQHPAVKVNCILKRRLLGIISVDFHVGQLLIIYSAFSKYLRKSGNKAKQCLSYLYTSRKLMIQLGGRSCIIFSLSLVSP